MFINMLLAIFLIANNLMGFISVPLLNWVIKWNLLCSGLRMLNWEVEKGLLGLSPISRKAQVCLSFFLSDFYTCVKVKSWYSGTFIYKPLLKSINRDIKSILLSCFIEISPRHTRLKVVSNLKYARVIEHVYGTPISYVLWYYFVLQLLSLFYSFLPWDIF